MKRVIILLAALLLASCEKTIETTIEPPAPNVHVVDSAWATIDEAYIPSAKAIDSTTRLDLEVSAYNASHLDDQWRIIIGDVPPIQSAPPASVSLVRTPDYSRLRSETVERSALSARRDELRAEAQAKSAVLYVETNPPPWRFILPQSPPAATPADPWDAYAVFIVYLSDGAIKLEEHDVDLGGYLSMRVQTLRSYVVQPWNAEHPDDQVGLIWGQSYTMPAGTEARP